MDYEVYPDIYLGGFADSSASVAPAVEAFGAFGAIIGIFYVLAFLFGVASYIMQAIAYMKMAKKTGVNNGWLAFIPIGNLYIIGRVADAGRGKRTCTKLLIGAMVAILVSSVILGVVLAASVISAPFADEVPAAFIAPIVLSVLFVAAVGIFYSVVLYVAYYRISNNFGGDNGIAYFLGILLGSFFMPIVSVILLLVLSAKQPKITDGVVSPVIGATSESSDSVF